VPLKAVVDGETITAPDLSGEEWASLKSRHKKGLTVTMACCGEPGHLRISKKGTQHFYHAADAGCQYAEESREHLEIKYQIYRVCASEQWETYVEFPAPDRTWISDIYAARDGRKVVFEVQISTISPADLDERDKKYRAEGIESYWLLDRSSGQSAYFQTRYDSLLCREDRPGEPIPYIDPSLFGTGPENRIFIATGTRTAGLAAKKQTLSTTNNPEIPLAVWVREVLKGNYRSYLEETAAVFQRKLGLKNQAAPLLVQFRSYYQKIIRDEAYRKKVDPWYRIIKNRGSSRSMVLLQKKVDELSCEIDWLANEYRSVTAESYGLFTWKKMREYESPRPFFRLESASKIKILQECVARFNQWDASFTSALGDLEREFPPENDTR